jgi:hypothetical protein
MDKGLFYSMLFENFGPEPLLAVFMPKLQKLAESQQVRPTFQNSMFFWVFYPFSMISD